MTLDKSQREKVSRSRSWNIILMLIFFAFVFAGAIYLAPPIHNSSFTSPIVSQETFAALLVAEVIGFVELARLMYYAHKDDDFDTVGKHFNRFLRLMIISIGSSMFGLLIAPISPSNSFTYPLLFISVISMFFLLWMSLDNIFI